MYNVSIPNLNIENMEKAPIISDEIRSSLPNFFENREKLPEIP